MSKVKSHKKRISAFWEGFLSIFGYSRVRYKAMSDTDAMRSDWEAIGQDIRIAMDKYKASCK